MLTIFLKLNVNLKNEIGIFQRCGIKLDVGNLTRSY